MNTTTFRFFATVLVCLFFVSALVGFGGKVAAEEPASLFDGETLDGWRGYGSEEVPSGWEVKDGAIVRSGGGGDLMTIGEYGDFELTLEWKISEGGNSGIMYRVSTGDSAPYFSGPEYQILDNSVHSDGKHANTSAGALYALYDTDTSAVRPVGEWNETRIVLRGNHVEHWLNGKKVVEAELHSNDWNDRVAASKFATWEPFGQNASGHIVLQDHGDLVWYRNIKLTQL